MLQGDVVHALCLLHKLKLVAVTIAEDLRRGALGVTETLGRHSIAHLLLLHLLQVNIGHLSLLRSFHGSALRLDFVGNGVVAINHLLVRQFLVIRVRTVCLLALGDQCSRSFTKLSLLLVVTVCNLIVNLALNISVSKNLFAFQSLSLVLHVGLVLLVVNLVREVVGVIGLAVFICILLINLCLYVRICLLPNDCTPLIDTSLSVDWVVSLEFVLVILNLILFFLQRFFEAHRSHLERVLNVRHRENKI